MLVTNKKVDEEKGDEVLARLMKTPPKPKQQKTQKDSSDEQT